MWTSSISPERAFIFLTFGYFAWRAQNRFLETPDLRFALLVLSELIPIGFRVFRPITKTISRRPSDWLFAISGSAMPLFITMAPLHPLAPDLLCYIRIIGGIGLQLFRQSLRRLCAIALFRGFTDSA